MIIEIRSKETAKDFLHPSWAAISITTENDRWPVLRTDGRKGLLRLRFVDARMPSLAFPHLNDELFTEELAVQIYDFVDSVKDDVEVMLVHCEQGMSRSPAIGAALDLYYGSESDIGIYFEKYRPNELVYRIMSEVGDKHFRP